MGCLKFKVEPIFANDDVCGKVEELEGHLQVQKGRRAAPQACIDYAPACRNPSRVLMVLVKLWKPTKRASNPIRPLLVAW